MPQLVGVLGKTAAPDLDLAERPRSTKFEPDSKIQLKYWLGVVQSSFAQRYRPASAHTRTLTWYGHGYGYGCVTARLR